MDSYFSVLSVFLKLNRIMWLNEVLVILSHRLNTVGDSLTASTQSNPRKAQVSFNKSSSKVIQTNI